MVIKLLTEALVTDRACVLRCKRHYFMANGINADTVAVELLVHANEEQGHADLIAARIVQLKGETSAEAQRHTHRETTGD
jgi:bacterioferritin